MGGRRGRERVREEGWEEEREGGRRGRVGEEGDREGERACNH